MVGELMETLSIIEPDVGKLNLQSAFSEPLTEWYWAHRRKLPWRETRNPYPILVSEIMLQQTQVKTVLPYFDRWMRRYPDVNTLARASESEVLKMWEGLGYYRRARLLHAAAKKIVSHHDGVFPKTAEELAELPGVGPYTLGAVASIAFDLPMPIVDGNVVRVLARWFGIRQPANSTATRKHLWTLAKSVLWEQHPGDFNQSMMELGATVCTPRHPLCLLCPIQQGCVAKLKGIQAELPKLTPGKKTVRQYEYAGLVIRGGRVLLCQRSTGRMEQMWQFPSVILPKPSKQWTESWESSFGPFDDAEAIATLAYSVTHHRIRLELHRIEKFQRRLVPCARWVDLAVAPKLTFTAAHRKMVDRFL